MELTIGQRVRQARKAKGYNQTELANVLGKSLRTIQKYESGEIEISVSMLNEIAAALDTTTAYLLGYETDKEQAVIDCLKNEIHLADYIDATYQDCVNVEMLKSVLSLICRQQAEIESLREVKAQLETDNRNEKMNYDLAVTEKNEAITDFAERLKERIGNLHFQNYGLAILEINELVHEITRDGQA